MEQHPTIVACLSFDARTDADVLHKAMKGFGTNEKALIDVLCHRTASQRVQIVHAYKSNYGRDLIDHLKSETSGNFEKVLVALCKSRADFMASEVAEAVAGLGTNEDALVEIFCSHNNQEIRDIVAAYRRLYSRSLEDDVICDTSGTLKMMLVSLIQGNRDEDECVDFAEAREDARRLLAAGTGMFGTEESVFNRILSTASWAYIRRVMQEYQSLTKKSLESAVREEFSGSCRDGYLAILKCAESLSGYLADRLHVCLAGVGTKDRALIRLIVSRCDIDLADIKDEFQKKFGATLAAKVAADCSGYYKQALLALIG